MQAPNHDQQAAAGFDLAGYLKAKQKLINDTLEQILRDTSNTSRVLEAMKYSLMAGGKRIRPVLCLAAAEAVGGGAHDRVLMPACALEMIHTYSLVHDDLPAMDNDNLRRGKPTCHIAFDEATAILAGDALLTLAFQLLSSIEFTRPEHGSKGLRVTHIIAKAAGHWGMIEGQMRDIEAEGRQLSLDELERMHALKTGALIEASVHVGGILGNGSAEQIEKLKIYAKNLGLAFQVTDDILNIVGDPAVMGKSVGTDSLRKKSTYPALLGKKQSRKLAEKLVNNALHALDIFDKQSDPLRAIAGYILHRKR
jgi:geranylgeranyl diphosphate synthase type II